MNLFDRHNPTVIIFCLLFSLSCCRERNPGNGTDSGKSDPSCAEQEALLFISGTNDRLYTDSVRYLMDITPLSSFGNYRKMYPRRSYVDPPVPASVGGETDKYYSAQWILLGDSLYLYAVDYTRETLAEKRRPHELDSLMEKMIRRKFVQDVRIRNLPMDSLSSGVIPADWFSGVIRIKRPNDKNALEQSTLREMLDTDYQWSKRAFWKLTFEHGKLVSKKRIDPVAEEKKIKSAQQPKNDNNPNRNHLNTRL